MSKIKQKKLLKYISTIIFMVFMINVAMTWLLLFFNEIFDSHIQASSKLNDLSIATTHESILQNYIYLYFTAYIVTVITGIYYHYPLFKILFQEEFHISDENQIRMVNLPVSVSKVVLYGWFYSVFQICVLIALDLIKFDGFIATNLATQLTISLAAYAFTFFSIDFYNRKIFLDGTITITNTEIKAQQNTLSFRMKVKTLFFAVVLFPCALFSVIIYFLLITNDSDFINQQYQVIFLMVLVVLFFGWLMSELLLVNFKHSFEELSVATHKIEQGDYDINLKITNFDEVGHLMGNINHMAYEIDNLNSEIIETQKEIIFTMGAIGESRSKETGNHVKRVAEYSRILAIESGLNDIEADILKQASPMHDIGKVGIPDSILNKPGRLTPDEREVMNTHAELGYEMLKNSERDILKAAAIVAYEHHEKWDGTGYPNKKIGKDIHIYGRITAIADVFDALGSERVYKETWTDERIFQLLREERGKHFDPQLVDIFFNKFHLFDEVRSELSDEK